MAKRKSRPIGLSAGTYQAKYAKPYVGGKSRSEWFKGLGAKGIKVKRVSYR